MTRRPVPMILDCDTGVDDTMAIMLAALHPDIELVGIGTIWGNVHTELATQNTLNMLAMCGKADVPVAEGEKAPLNGSAFGVAYHVHGNDGQGNAGMKERYGKAIDKSAAEFIVEMCRKRPGEIELVPVGPLTNIAKALELDPELPKLVRGVTIMGGTAMAPGNVSPVAEANVWHDPEAAAMVFDAPWSITMVGLDVTMKTLMEEEHFARLRNGGTIAQHMERIVKFYTDFNAEVAFGVRKATMHDAVAVAYAAELLKARVAPIVNAYVDTSDGPGRGQTICDLRGIYRGYPAQEGAHCRVLLEVEPGFPDFFTDFLASAGDSHVPVSY